MLQRLNCNTFTRDDVAEHLDMSQQRLGTGLGGAVLQQRVDELKRLTDARGPFGRQSHRRVWTDLYEILSVSPSKSPTKEGTRIMAEKDDWQSQAAEQD